MKFLEKMVKLISEIDNLRAKADFLRGELENTVGEMTDYLKSKNLLESRDIGDELEVNKYINYYECECGNRWDDVYFHTCNDHCEDCGLEISPYETKDFDE